jgi:hypothetical protein
MLIGQVIFAFVIPQAVDVVHPTTLGAEMELAPVGLVIIGGKIREFRIWHSERTEMRAR